jgi:hypothetical protein
VKRIIQGVLLIVAFNLAAEAQEPIHGSVTAGYRFTDVAGRKEKFDELFSLRSGFRVHDFSLYQDREQPNPFFDSFFISTSGIGGEPFSGGQFKISKKHVYDLRLNYQQSYFYWNRNDDAIHPTGLHGLTTNHDWSTVRKIGSVNLTAYATDRLRFNFEYHHTGRDGQTLTTRTLDYFGAPSTWGGFLRANPYVVQAPVDEDSHRVTGGISYSARNWSFFYKAGYQTFKENIQMNNLRPGERSINIDEAATANELLDVASWTDVRKLRTPISEFSYNGRVSSRIRLRGGYIFYRYSGPRSLNASFAGRARTTTATAIAPYSVTLQDQAEVSEHNHVIDQGFSFEVTPKLNFHTDYRYSRFNIDADAQFRSTTTGAAPAAGEARTQWEDGMHILDVALEIAPARQLQLRPGIRLMKRDVTVLGDGVADPVASKRSKIASPILTVYYSPSRQFTVRGDIQSSTNGTPYTRISPRKDFNVRSIVRYQPRDNFSIDNNLRLRTAEYTTTDYRNSIRSNATTITYRLSDRLALLGGFTYDSFLATASITFLRGVAPLSAIWRDQTVNRVWQAGIEAKPVKKLTFNLSGNYVRTTGAGEISGEPPTFGPLRWPLVTGTVSYDLARAGRLSIDLQRTYYIEQIMRGDNFSANLLNIRWTREF